MRWTRRWFFFVAAYTFGFGATLLLAAPWVPFAFEPIEETWVRVFGALVVGISIFQVELARSGRPFMLRAGLVYQSGAALGLAYMASHDSPGARMALAVVLIGLLGSGIGYLREAKDASLPTASADFVLLPRTARWNLYVASYTLVLGILCALAPLLIFPLLGFPPTDGPWVRAAGCALLVLCHINWQVYRAKGSARYIFAIYLLRCFILAALLVMTLSGFPLGLLVAAGLLAIGLVGTTLSYFPEMRSATR